MSTVVFQGLQSCLEPQLTETRTLWLKLALPKPCCSLESNISSATEETKTNPDLGGWVFLQSLSNSSQTPNKEIPYVHPMLKPSSSNLSDKSLELCTENLGSETGTEITETSNISLSFENSNAGKSPTREYSRKVKNNSLSFPPPLTTMTGLNPLQVRPHREGGRLIITAVETTTSPHTYFQAERSQGRLRLSLWKECNNCSTSSTTTFDLEENEDSDMEEHENETNDEEKEEREEFEEEEKEEEKEKDEEEEEEEEEEESDVCVRGEDMDGDSLDGGVEMGMEKFRRPNRCNDGGNNNSCLGNWEPFWVPIS